MPGKGKVKSRAAMTNSFRFEVDGLPDIYFVRFGELERMIVLAEMPDKTMQSTGQVNPGETEADTLLHHTADRLALEALHRLAEGGLLGNKVDGTLYFLGADGFSVKAAALIQGAIFRGRKTPELNTKEDGEAVVQTWTVSYDDVDFL